MTGDLESALRQLLKDVLREVAADLVKEWTARHQAPQFTPADDDYLLTPRETAKRLAISERHLFQLARSGRIPCVRVGKCVRYNIKTIQKWVQEAESTEQPSSAERDAPKQASAAPEPEATTSPRRKPKHAAGKKQRGSAREKAPELERGSAKVPQPVSKGRPQEVRSEERISPLSVLLSELGIDRSNLPPIANGDLMRIAEVDIATMHGWLHLNRSLPEGALNRLRNQFRYILKE